LLKDSNNTVLNFNFALVTSNHITAKLTVVKIFGLEALHHAQPLNAISVPIKAGITRCDF